MDKRTDEEIIAAVLQGNTEDFRFIIERYRKLAYHTAYSLIRRHEDAEEVVQDAFMKAFSALSSFRGASKFSTWFFRIVYYTGLNRLEKFVPEKVSTDDLYGLPSGNDSWDLVHEKERLNYLQQALDLLPPEDRLALNLYYLGERSHKEISELTGWNLSATKVRIHRARARIDQLLDKLLKEEKKSLL